LAVLQIPYVLGYLLLARRFIQSRKFPPGYNRTHKPTIYCCFHLNINLSDKLCKCIRETPSSCWVLYQHSWPRHAWFKSQIKSMSRSKTHVKHIFVPSICEKGNIWWLSAETNINVSYMSCSNYVLR
jgi:hypothetical protein